MRAQVGIRTSFMALSAAAALLSTQASADQPLPSSDPNAWYFAPDPTTDNWPMTPVKTLAPDQSPMLPNASAFVKGVYVDYSWAFPTHGTGNRQFVYTMSQPFVAPSIDGTLPPSIADDGSVTPLDVLSTDYTLNCSGQLDGNVYASDGSAAPQYVCTIYNAPSFDAKTLISALANAGWNFSVVFPMSDPGTGKALVFWSSDPLDAANGQLPQHQGFARVYNINWQDQFPATDVALCDYQGGACIPNGNTYTFAHADAIGDYIAGLRSPFRESTFRGYQMFATETPVSSDPDATPTTTAYPYPVVVTDSWISTAPNPQLPPLAPTVVGGTAPDPLNVAQGGSGAAIGKAGSAIASASAVVPFDRVAFCSAPGKDGKPRSPLWINTCIASAPH